MPKTMTKIKGTATINAAKKLVHPTIRPKVSNLMQHKNEFTRHILVLYTLTKIQADHCYQRRTKREWRKIIEARHSDAKYRVSASPGFHLLCIHLFSYTCASYKKIFIGKICLLLMPLRLSTSVSGEKLNDDKSMGGRETCAKRFRLLSCGNFPTFSENLWLDAKKIILTDVVLI